MKFLSGELFGSLRSTIVWRSLPTNKSRLAEDVNERREKSESVSCGSKQMILSGSGKKGVIRLALLRTTLENLRVGISEYLFTLAHSREPKTEKKSGQWTRLRKLPNGPSVYEGNLGPCIEHKGPLLRRKTSTPKTAMTSVVETLRPRRSSPCSSERFSGV